MEIKNFLLGLFFPKFCFLCQREGDYLCQDCQALLEISTIHQNYKTKYLSDLYFPCLYEGPLIKKLIQGFKYEPFVKELAKLFSALIIEHFQLIDNKPNFENYILVPIPLEKRKLKRRGFNQAEEISRELSSFLGIPLISDCLIKTKETTPQVELETSARKENIKGVFSLRNKELVKNKKILLVDDVYTTGSTMEEAAKVLKEAGAREVIGVVIARAKPGQDHL